MRGPAGDCHQRRRQQLTFQRRHDQIVGRASGGDLWTPCGALAWLPPGDNAWTRQDRWTSVGDACHAQAWQQTLCRALGIIRDSQQNTLGAVATGRAITQRYLAERAQRARIRLSTGQLFAISQDTGNMPEPGETPKAQGLIRHWREDFFI